MPSGLEKRLLLAGAEAGPSLPVLPVAFVRFLIAFDRLRPRFPQLKPGLIGAAAQEIERLKSRGLEPVTQTDPFTGNLVIGTADQPITQLLEERFQRSLIPQEDPAEIFALREKLIELKQQTALQKGFFPSVESLPKVPQGVVCGLSRATADAPLTFTCRRV